MLSWTDCRAPPGHECRGELWHGPHGDEHDAEEADSKEGTRPGRSLGSAAKQGTNDQTHDNDLQQDASCQAA